MTIKNTTKTNHNSHFSPISAARAVGFKLFGIVLLVLLANQGASAQFGLEERYIEHVFDNKDFSLEIDVKKKKGYTTYKYC